MTLRILAIDCSPTGSGSTNRALGAVTAAAADEGAECRTVTIADVGTSGALNEILDADAFVFGSPMWRATYAAPFKTLLDIVPRGMWGETEAPLTAKAVAIVATAASLHHFLGLAHMRNVLVDFFAAHVLSPGLYIPKDGFAQDGALTESVQTRAVAQGRGLVALAEAISASPALRGVLPQA